jgi:hypothetical protein
MAERAEYLHDNARELARMRGLVERLTDEDLARPVNEWWSVAGVLCHIAFWDGRALALCERLRRRVPFSPSDAEPEDVDWINDASRPLIHAISPGPAARLALEIGEQTDAMVASLTEAEASAAWPNDPESPLNLDRSGHRGEHLDEIEAALDRQGVGRGRAG